MTRETARGLFATLIGAVIGPLVIVGLFAQTAPVITAVTASGGQLVLTGSGFGTHADYGGPAPFLNAAWNDFATGINGGNLALDGTNNAAWSYQTTGGRTPSKRWARKDWNPAIDDSIRRLGALSLVMSGTGHDIYQSFHLRCGPGVVQAAKFWRIYGLLANPNDGSTQQNIFLSITDGFNLMAGGGGPGTPEATTVWAVQTGPLQCATRWQRFEIYMRDTAGDDYLRVDIDGVQAFQRGSQLPSKPQPIEGSVANERQHWVASPWGGDGHTIDFGHMVDQDFFGYSDAFVDYTRARVELSNASTWAAARVKEIQPALQWIDGRIVATVNPGTFTTGQALFAYVVHANGSVNAAGFPVTLGGTTPPPTPVDCVTSAWSAWAPTGPPTACIGGMQSVTESRTRTIVTPPANGGLACGPLSETRTVTQSCTPPVDPPLPPSDGCLLGTVRYPKGAFLFERMPDGTAAQQQAIGARTSAALAAGFLPYFPGRVSPNVQLLFVCARP